MADLDVAGTYQTNTLWRRQSKTILGFTAMVILSLCRCPQAYPQEGGQLNLTQSSRGLKQTKKGEPTDLLIVRLAKDADREKFRDLLLEVHGTITKTLNFGSALSFLIIQTEPGTVAAVERRFRQNKDINLVQRNLICRTNDYTVQKSFGHLGRPVRFRPVRIRAPHYHGFGPAPAPPPASLPKVPSDPLFPVQWDLGMMNYEAARVSAQSTNVPVPMYFVDTGVAYQPPEIGTNAVQFNCFDPPDSGVVQESLFDSGTHGSGTTTVTAATDNGIGYSGVANFENNRVQLVMCRITNGGITDATVEGILTALNFIYSTSWFAPGPINVSVGSAPPDTLNSLTAIQSAAQQLRQKGFLVVLAAGNSAAYDSSPELYARRVLALSQNGYRASFSNYGAFSSAAPGDNVPIYLPGSIAEWFGSGTSFAAPRWCSAIAIVMGALPANLRTAPYADAIVSATATTSPEGYKIPNLKAAIQMAATAQ